MKLEAAPTLGIDNDVTYSSQKSQVKKVKLNIADNYSAKIKELRYKGKRLRSDVQQPKLSQKPPWFDKELFENAKTIYARHFMAINFAHLSGLLLLVRNNSIFRTLSVTGKSDSVSKLFERYYHTIIQVKKWYEGDIFDENSDAHRSLLIVRGMHNRVSTKLNAINTAASTNHSESTNENSIVNQTDNLSSAANVHISQYDLFITLYAFIGLIVIRPTKLGLIDCFSQRDLESLLHFWRVIGFYLGAHEEFNLCSYELSQMTELCETIAELEFKQSIAENVITTPPGVMSVNIVRSLKFIPMLTTYGIFRYLYELLDIEDSEIKDRETGYSKLSYTFIKLVMSTLLAYRCLRWFNNGLTRLSLFLVGKVEDWFKGHLESKYRSDGLKI